MKHNYTMLNLVPKMIKKELLMDLHDRILNFISNFKFDDYIDSIQVELVDENYKSFTDEFWQNPSANITKLKSKHNFPSSIPFSAIFIQHPTGNYLNLIKDCWNPELSINYIVQKYGIPFQKIKQIIFPNFMELLWQKGFQLNL